MNGMAAHTDPESWSTEDWRQEVARRGGARIDLTLDRVRAVLPALNLQLPAAVLTVAGTNGKGSACAMAESIIRHAGYRTGVYYSPPLTSLHDTIRIDDRPVAEATLAAAMHQVSRASTEVPLTWYELCTLAALVVLCKSQPDALVLEVGMGGRVDAVNAIDADCALVTNVDVDHTEFLGPDRESIGLQKAGIFRTGRPAVVSDPVPPQSMIDRAREIEADLWLFGRDFNYAGDRQQWSWAGRSKRYNGLAYPALRGANQLLNAAGVLAALESLRDRLPISAQAVRAGLANVELPGRFQIVPGQPTLVLDVAHNPHSIATLAVNLDQMGFYPRTHAVFGAMRDKDIRTMLARMSSLVDTWHFCDLPTPRAVTAKELEALLQEMQLKGPGEVSVQCHPGPIEALRFALAGADPADRIIVFGSFYTVGGVLKEGLPRTSAAHLG
jgi:dihydrofolate synthase/folylpolyglutamate synthase